jgi:hypothetical protein
MSVLHHFRNWPNAATNKWNQCNQGSSVVATSFSRATEQQQSREQHYRRFVTEGKEIKRFKSRTYEQ